MSAVAVTPARIRKNAFLLAAGLVCNSGMFQLAAALSSLTLVAVTGITGILGLGPAIFLTAGGLTVGPAGRLMDRVGRMPVIRGAFVLGAIGCGVVAGGCSLSSAPIVALGLALVGAAGAVVQLSRAAAAEMFPEKHRARGMSFVLFGAVSGAIWGPILFGPLFAHRLPDRTGSRCAVADRHSVHGRRLLRRGLRPPGPEGDLADVHERARRLDSSGARCARCCADPG